MTEIAEHHISTTLEVAAAGSTVAVVAPTEGEHAGVFTELFESIFHGFRRLGFVTSRGTSLRSQRVDHVIVLGAFALSNHRLAALPENAIIYNTEHFSFISARPRYMDLLCKHRVWDYSQDNAERLPALLGREVLYVPLGFVPELARIEKAEHEDIDVLFCGSSNPRRRAVLQSLRAAGLTVHAAFGVYGAVRDALIARSKVVLNMHYYQPGAFEAVRVSYLLANRKAVVSECNPGEYVDPDLAEALSLVPYERLVEECGALVADINKRRQLEERGYDAFSARDQAAILRQALDADLAGVAMSRITTDPTAVPRRLNLGSGKDWRPHYLNLDSSQAWNPDIVADICDAGLFGYEHHSQRFGSLRLERGYFDEIIAFDVLEHVTDLVTAMTHCLALLREGGIMRIHVPYDLSFGAWQDPTHVRAFNERSWWYYCQWFWYLGWSQARFDLTRLEYGFSPLGVKMKAAGISDDEVARTPRAVDQMRAILRKRHLTAEEQLQAQRMRQRPAQGTDGSWGKKES